jgi:NADPH2:quinone reductase
MEAMVLVRNGTPHEAFERRELPDPEPVVDQVRIAVEAFGLNFADCMARIGVYQDAPPLPAVLGYECTGVIDAVGPDVDRFQVGDRVVGFTRFGGYATKAVTEQGGVAKLPAELGSAEALGIPTQFGTAYFCAEEMTRIHPGDNVLVQAAAGGVGNGIVQLAKRRGARVFATAGSDEKLEFLHSLGVDHPINYRENDFASVVRDVLGSDDGLDIAYDSIGGKSVDDTYKLLTAGGRIVCYGAAAQAGQKKSLWLTLKMALGFPFTHPIRLLLASQGVIGVNMLRIADSRPDTMARVLDETVALVTSGELKVKVGGRFTADQLGDAHELLHGRKSIGKLVVFW